MKKTKLCGKYSVIGYCRFSLLTSKVETGSRYPVPKRVMLVHWQWCHADGMQIAVKH